MLRTLIVVGLCALVLINVRGICPYIVMSGSMEPTIPVGAVCLVDTQIPYERIREGDVIAYETSQGMPVTHRVVKINKEGMVTQGDANRVTDGLSVSEDNFLGKTVFWIPYAGYILKCLQNHLKLIMGLLLLVFVKNIADSKRG